jgi:protein O-mannosyl-transferase
MVISRKKVKQAKKLYPSKPIKEIASMLEVNAEELTRALKDEGVEFKLSPSEIFPRAKANWLHLLLLALCVAALYANSLQNTFHYDDYHSLTENIVLRKLSNIPSFFKDPQSFSSKPGVRMIRPILLTTFAINYAWTEYKAWSWEAVNVGIHLLNVLLLYIFLAHMTGKQKFAALASLVFAVHPVNTESVNYINCRSTLLVSTFMIISLYGFVRALMTRSRFWHSVYIAAFAAGFFVKEEAIVVLALALVIDVLFIWPKGRADIFERIVFFYLPFLLVIGIYFGIRQSQMRVLIQDARPRPIWVNLLTESRVVVRYFNLLIWPIHLNTSYDVEVFTELIKDKVGFAIVYLCVWLGLALLLWKKLPVFTFFVLNFFITLSPTTVIPLNATMNEHRLYLPSLGLGILLAFVFMKMEHGLSGYKKAALSGALILFFALLGVLVVNRNRLWISDMALWRDAISKSPTKAQVISDLGNAYYRKVPQDLDRAEQLYKWAVSADDTYFKAFHNLAIISFSRGDNVADKDPALAQKYYQTSVDYFKQAVSIYPWNPDSWNDMGTAYLKLKDYPNAETNYMKAIKMDPRYFKGYYNLGYVLGVQKKYPEAEEFFRNAIKIYDHDPKIWFSLANTLYEEKKYTEALQVLDQAKNMFPEEKALKDSYDRLYKFIQQLKTGTTPPPP